MIHPDVIDALVAAGATAAMIAAAYRADYFAIPRPLDNGATQPGPLRETEMQAQPAGGPTAFEAKREADKLRQRRYRAASRQMPLPFVTPPVTPSVTLSRVTVTPSLKEESKKKKRETSAPEPIPIDWKPDKASHAVALEVFAEHTETAIASFCDWARATGAKRDDWQAQFRWHCRNQSKQPQLPLGGVSVVKGSSGNARRGTKSRIEIGSELAATIRDIERRAAAELGGISQALGGGTDLAQASA